MWEVVKANAGVVIGVAVPAVLFFRFPFMMRAVAGTKIKKNREFDRGTKIENMKIKIMNSVIINFKFIVNKIMIMV